MNFFDAAKSVMLNETELRHVCMRFLTETGWHFCEMRMYSPHSHGTTAVVQTLTRSKHSLDTSANSQGENPAQDRSSGRLRPGHQRFVITGGGARRGVQQAPGGGRLPEAAGAGALGSQGGGPLLLHPQRLIPRRLCGGRRLQGWQWLPPHWRTHGQVRPMHVNKHAGIPAHVCCSLAME